MNTYRIEIQNLASGENKIVPVPGCGWTDDAPEQYRTRMCDCNLAGYFNADLKTSGGKVSQTPHQVPANMFIEYHGCDHSMPPTRFRAVRAHLDGGGVVQL